MHLSNLAGISYKQSVGLRKTFLNACKLTIALSRALSSLVRKYILLAKGNSCDEQRNVFYLNRYVDFDINVNDLFYCSKLSSQVLQSLTFAREMLKWF